MPPLGKVMRDEENVRQNHMDPSGKGYQ